MALRCLPATVGVRVVLPVAALLGEAHPLLGTAATGVAAVEPVVPPVLDVVVVGSEAGVVDDVDEFDVPQAAATTATATIATPQHAPRLLSLPGLTAI